MPETRGRAAVLERPTQQRERRPRLDSQPQDPLPIALVKQELMNAVLSHDTVVLRAGTGSGKSTLGPYIFWEALQRANPQKKVKMIVAEPRQFLAESVSRRVATLHNVLLGGDLVGYYHGDSQKYSKENTQIIYTVSGSLRKRIEENKSLEAYDAVFLDEIHLRDADQEAILIGLKEVQKHRAKKGLAPLKIVIASASAQQKYGDYYGNAILKEVEGEKPKYSVEKFFADKAIDREQIPIEMARLAAKIVKQEKNYGDVVGFLPGRHEIQMAIDEFNRIMQAEGLAGKYKCGSFTGGGGAENKALQAKLADDDEARDPMVAFVTDVAETGATFARLTKVIDSGKLRTMVYNKETGLESLQTRDHAYTHYLQRLGRLARTGDGEFHALYPEADLLDESKHPKEALPSVLKEDLTPLILSLKKMDIIDVHNVDYIDHPGKDALDRAVNTLQLLGAIHPDGRLTDEGREMAELPLDPHFARMLIEAKKRGCVEPVSVLIGFLNNGKSVFAFNPKAERFDQKYARYIHSGSDYITLLNVWNTYVTGLGEEEMSEKEMAEWKQEMSKFSASVLRDVRATKYDLLGEEIFAGLRLKRKDTVFDLSNKDLLDDIQKSIVAGLADRLLVLNPSGAYSLKDGRKGNIAPDRSSVMTRNPASTIASGAIRVLESGRAFATYNQEVKKEWLDEVAPYLKTLRSAEEAERERKAAVAEAERIMYEHRPPTQEIRAPLETTVSPVAEKKLSFIAKIKKAIASFFDRIKKFLGIK